MNEHQSKLGPGQIQFHQWCKPPLEPRDYTVDVTHAVAELRDTPFTNQFKFSVAGPRFSLDPSEIYCVYPPKGHIGDFANSLPHVVFTRRTLPWERSLVPGPRKPPDKLPWMALLVLGAADFSDGTFPEIKQRKVGELLSPSTEDNAVGPALRENNLAAYESKKNLCNTVDIPWDLFQKVAPSKEDLGYLAHVREVDTGNKETLSFLADGWFSVVLANRFPEPERKGTNPPLTVENRALLVSLEGLKDYLPGSDKNPGRKPVRLAVLASWSFHCREAFAFKASMDTLDVRRLCVPWQDTSAANGSPSEAENHVREAFQRGYTALNHNLRNGEKTVSWYRGPLVPLYLTKETKYRFRPAADAALRYNPLDGMMDVTYAAAIQLGRLLGLQDRHFATALYAYRTRIQTQINQALGRQRLRAALSTSAVDKNAKDETESEIMSTYLKMLSGKTSGPPSQKKTDTGTSDEAFSRDHGTSDEAFSRDKNTDELRLTTDFNLTIPKTVCKWLARLILVYRVPFPYLVPDERMLPPDSMRFFYLDPGWLKCLLEGACSVGRTSSRDELVDEYLRDKFLNFALEESLQVRTRTPEKSSGAADTIAVTKKPSAFPDWPLTGFLIRSPVVEGWQGLEMRAWNEWKDDWEDGGNKTEAQRKLANEEKERKRLMPLRIDRLAPDIMLCIFNGKVKRIEIKQPPEGMHFGAAPDGEGGYTKFHLRWLVTDAVQKKEPGDQIEKDSKTPILLRDQVSRVVDIVWLAKSLKDKLKAFKAMASDEAFTSAAFGVQMVESPGRVVFDAAYKETSAP
jgi:hypothetical protein